MKVLVTGGAGFIGSHTVDALLRKGHKVRILDNFAKPVHLKGRPSYLQKDAQVIEGDVRNKDDWAKSLEGIDAVFHFAAYQDYLPDFGTFFHINSVGTALLYEVAVEKSIPINKVIVASSQSVYGEGRYRCTNDSCCQSSGGQNEHYPSIRSLEQLRGGQWNHSCPCCGSTLKPEPTDESRVNPQNQYAVSKYTQELISLNLGRRYNIPTVALRYSIVQGPRQSLYNAYSGACRIFCLSHFLNKQPVIYEDGLQIRDFVNIEDVVNANLLVLENDRADYNVFNVGGGQPYTVLQFAQIVADVGGGRCSLKIPGQYRFGDTRHILSDISKLRSLGWKPKQPPQKSVRDYLEWLSSQQVGDNILEYAEKKMIDLNVVQMVES